MERLAQLQQFLDEDPLDPFNYYALALEYQKSDPSAAYKLFNDLLTKFPDYLPTYYPFADQLIERDEISRAEEVFQSGIAKAKEKGDQKTLKELQAAYNDWLFERE